MTLRMAMAFTRGKNSTRWTQRCVRVSVQFLEALFVLQNSEDQKKVLWVSPRAKLCPNRAGSEVPAKRLAQPTDFRGACLQTAWAHRSHYTSLLFLSLRTD